MKGKLGEFNVQIEICFKLLDTPGDEITPGSDKVGKYFENQSIRHKNLLCESTAERRQPAAAKTRCAVAICGQPQAIVDSRVDVQSKSKPFPALEIFSI
jgi:hypothetical protein